MFTTLGLYGFPSGALTTEGPGMYCSSFKHSKIIALPFKPPPHKDKFVPRREKTLVADSLISILQHKA